MIETACTLAKDYLNKLREFIEFDVSDSREFILKLILKLHDCASSIGFLSLASAAAAHHDKFLSGIQTDLYPVIESLEAELRCAEAEWEAEAGNRAPSNINEAVDMACGDAHVDTRLGSATSVLRASVAQQYLESRE